MKPKKIKIEPVEDRTEIIRIRVYDHEKKQYREAAKKRKVTLSEFMRQSAQIQSND